MINIKNKNDYELYLLTHNKKQSNKITKNYINENYIYNNKQFNYLKENLNYKGYNI